MIQSNIGASTAIAACNPDPLKRLGNSLELRLQFHSGNRSFAMTKVNLMNSIDRRTFDRKVLEKPPRTIRFIGFVIAASAVSLVGFAIVFVNNWY